MAEEAAGLLTSPFVKLAVSKLGSAIGEQASLLWSFTSDLENMKATMESISAALKDAERRSATDESVRLWLKRLKKAAYDICDMLEIYQDDTDRATAKMPGIISCLPITCKRISLANKTKNMREELRQINEQFQSFHFTSNPSTTISQQDYDPREMISYVNEEQIIGREGEKQRIMTLLSASHNNDETTILPIYGLGGIGKSTLARLVYNDTQFIKKYDNTPIWVYVSQDFDLNKIGRRIIYQLAQTEGGQYNTDSLEAINRCLDGLLRGKKVLMVLDDLWKEEDLELEKLKNMLHVGKKGYMIDVIVTTRNKDIANKICTNRSFELLPLKDERCWEIIKRYSQFENLDKHCQEQLLLIGLDIAKKCGGVALAAQSLGYMLKSKAFSMWLEVNNSDIWNESSSNNTVLPSLKLSYECMPPLLKLCFAYCAIFPKGYDIVHNYLIHQWIALDFIEPSNKRMGETFVKNLLGMSFLQYSKIPTNSKKHVARYTMHDLVHDLARSIVGDELNVFYATAAKSNKLEKKYCHYALLKEYEHSMNLSKLLPPKLRALHFSDSSNLDLPRGSFSFAKHLRILDFSECLGILLPAAIGQLKQLKYLIAPRMQNERFPECITELLKLQYLNMNGSPEISTLPESIGKLGCLEYLDLSGFSSLKELPESFGELRSMVHLDMSHCSQIRELPASLGNLTNLQRLDLSGCFSVKAMPQYLSGLTQLQYLNISFCHCLEQVPEEIGSLVSLEYLNMSYCERIRELPESFGKLRNLLHLDLEWCEISQDLPRALCGLTALQHLDLTNRGGVHVLFAIGDVPRVLRNLTNLRYLNLSEPNWSGLGHHNYDIITYVDLSTLTNLEHLNLSRNKSFELTEGIGNLKSLHTLNLSYCKDLKSLPKSIGELKLRSLLMDGCIDQLIAQAKSLTHYSQTLPLFKVRDDDASGCSNLHLLKDVDVGELNIRYLEKVRSPEEACKAEMWNKTRLLKLSLMWTPGADRLLEDMDLLEEMVPPKGLRDLDLEGYSSPSLPRWLVGGTSISHHLPNVVYLLLRDLPTCSSLPPLGQLPSLERLVLDCLPSIRKINEDLCGGKGAFRRLLLFSMDRMDGLEEWNTTCSVEDGVEQFMFPMLDDLRIYSCPMLRLKPCPPRFRTCHIRRSSQVISSLEELPQDNSSHRSSASSRITLSGDAGAFSRTLRMFDHFPALQDLTLSFNSELARLPESMRSLTSLESLELGLCYRVSELPEWLSQLSSLKILRIKYCPEIKCLPSCIQKLTKLQELVIVGNQELAHWCELEENKKMLAHIKNIILW